MDEKARASNAPSEQGWRDMLQRVHLSSCYHEAAHAVLDSDSGYSVRCVRARGDVPEGYVCVTSVPAHPYQAQAFETAASVLAGEFAVYTLYGKERPRPDFEEFMEQDKQDAECDAELAGLDEAQTSDLPRALKLLTIRADGGMVGPYAEDPRDALRGWFDFAWDDAERRVVELWPEISGVAGRLAEAGCLSGEEVRGIIASVREDRAEP